MSSKGLPFQRFKKFVGDLQSQKNNSDFLPHLLIFSGTCEYFHEETKSELKTYWLQKKGGSFQKLQKKDLLSQDPQSFWGEQSLFEPSPMYYISKADDFQEPLMKWLLKSSSRPKVSQSTLVLVFKKSLTPKWKKLCLQKKISHYIWDQPAKTEISSLVRFMAERQEVKLDASAVELARNSWGESLMILKNELAKLSLFYRGHEAPLTSEDICKHVGVVGKKHAFYLQDLILDGKGSEALVLANTLISEKSSALPTLGLLSRFIRLLLQFSDAAKKNNPPTELGRQFRLPYPIIKRYNEYIRNHNQANLRTALIKCQEADTLIKSSKNVSVSLLITDIILSLGKT